MSIFKKSVSSSVVDAFKNIVPGDPESLFRVTVVSRSPLFSLERKIVVKSRVSKP